MRTVPKKGKRNNNKKESREVAERVCWTAAYHAHTDTHNHRHTYTQQLHREIKYHIIMSSCNSNDNSNNGNSSKESTTMCSSLTKNNSWPWKLCSAICLIGFITTLSLLLRETTRTHPTFTYTRTSMLPPGCDEGIVTCGAVGATASCLCTNVDDVNDGSYWDWDGFEWSYRRQLFRRVRVLREEEDERMELLLIKDCDDCSPSEEDQNDFQRVPDHVVMENDLLQVTFPQSMLPPELVGMNLNCHLQMGVVTCDSDDENSSGRSHIHATYDSGSWYLTKPMLDIEKK